MGGFFSARDYRGATVEDLDIRPAILINPSTELGEALEIAFENDFTNLPVIDEDHKKLLGILNIDAVDRKDNDFLKPVVKNYMLWFSQRARAKYDAEHAQDGAKASRKTPLSTTIKTPTQGRIYTVLTPFSPLEELATFFNSGNQFAIITNPKGTFVYGVATPDDLTKFEKSRPKL